MNKMIRGGAAAAVVIIAAAAMLQWNGYRQKTELRDNALLYFKEQDYSKTIRYLEQALDKHSFFSSKLNHDMTCYLAESYYQLKNYEEADNIYDRLIKENPREARYYQLKGRCAKEAGETQQAVEVFSEGWEKTEQSEFLKAICDIYLEQEDYEKALEVTKQGIQAGGDAKQQFMYQEVVIYEKSQDYAAAYKAVTEYCELFPDDKNAQKEKVFLSTRV